MREQEKCSARATHLWFSLSFFCSVTWDNIWGNTPKSIGTFKQSLKPTVSFLFTPSLFKTGFLAFSARTHTQRHACVHTHTNMLNHTVDTEIQTYAFFHPPIQTERAHACTWTYCSIFTLLYTFFLLNRPHVIFKNV